MNGRKDETWFRDLYRRYYGAIVAYFVSSGFSRDDARDFAHETFYRVYRSMESYKGQGDFSFLKKTAVRIGLNAIRDKRTQKRNAPVVSLDELPYLPDSAAASVLSSEPQKTPEEELSERQEEELRRKKLRAAMAELPDGERECLLLRLQGLKYGAIAGALGISVDAVKSRLHEARNALKAKIGSAPDLKEDDRD
jgi:RNA polymerase sigma-70 factor, ECF subfamily